MAEMDVPNTIQQWLNTKGMDKAKICLNGEVLECVLRTPLSDGVVFDVLSDNTRRVAPYSAIQWIYDEENP